MFRHLKSVCHGLNELTNHENQAAKTVLVVRKVDEF